MWIKSRYIKCRGEDSKNVVGFGCGDSSGYGYGYGIGSGDGVGDGDGWGKGNADGDGDGEGEGYGCGSGSGVNGATNFGYDFILIPHYTPPIILSLEETLELVCG